MSNVGWEHKDIRVWTQMKMLQTEWVEVIDIYWSRKNSQGKGRQKKNKIQNPKELKKLKAKYREPKESKSEKLLRLRHTKKHDL